MCEKDVLQLKKRIAELAEKSYEHNIYTYTGFLNMAEQNAFYGMVPRLQGIDYGLYGGRTGNERQMLRFGSEESTGYYEEYPITCILIEPLLEKFADTMTHRDYLGAVMNLGIDRSTVGDIYIHEKNAYIFCSNKMEEYLINNLDKVKHTNVRCSAVKLMKNIPLKEPEEIRFTVTSERADGIIAKLYKLSRNESLTLFREKKVYVNGRLNENNSCIMKNGDIVSVRGFGKFVYYGAGYETKKGKWSVSAGVYK